MFRVCFAGLLALFLASAMLAQEAKAPVSAEGIFEGPLKVGAIDLRLGFHLKKKEDGKWEGKFDSIDQGARNIPLSAVNVEGENVTLEFKAGGAKFVGKLGANGQTLEGIWEQAGARYPLKLKRVDKATVLLRPQEPKKPYPYQEIDVAYDNPSASGVKLAGSLTVPKGDGPFPCVIMITGSGPQDRNEELLGHKPFLVIADHLTRQGIAVLRFDDRGVAKSKGNFATANSADFATDVIAGLEFLKTRKEIDPKKIGLMGHSEGGLIAPMVAAARSDVAFIVMLAGPGLSGEEVLRLQAYIIGKKMGASEESLKKQAALSADSMKVLREEPDDAKAIERMKQLVDQVLAGLSPTERKEMIATFGGAGKATEEKDAEAMVKKLLEAQMAKVASPWFRYFLTYDPRATLAKVKCPVLALNGELDLQVTIDENLPAVEKALKEGGNKDVTCVRLPELNHLFQHTKTGLPSEYGTIEETFDPKALELIGEWIKKRTK